MYNCTLYNDVHTCTMHEKLILGFAVLWFLKAISSHIDTRDLRQLGWTNDLEQFQSLSMVPNLPTLNSFPFYLPISDKIN